MHPLLNIAVKASRAAGNVIIKYMDRVESLTITSKGKNDYVSEVDRQAEAEIIHIIHKAYPQHGILAEEGGFLKDGILNDDAQKDDDYLWIIDPLDGTTNFLHGFPQFAVSIALTHKGVLDQAVIFDPVSNEMYTASRGCGAFLNDKRIRVSKAKHLEGALLGTGFPFKQHQYVDCYLQMFKSLMLQTAGIRRAGSAALDLAYVASGRLDGFWEIGLKPWDLSAGVLLIEEAGGLVTDFNNNTEYMKSGNIICGNHRMHQAMHQAIQPFLTKELFQ